MSVPVIFSTGSLYPFGLGRAYSWAAEAGFDLHLTKPVAPADLERVLGSVAGGRGARP